MAVIEFKSEAEWHVLRTAHVGASEVAALFGLSPWTTRWQLHMRKLGKLDDKINTASMDKGRHFEPAIASYAREELDLDVTKVTHYWTDELCAGFGASLDYTLANDVGVPVEIKWAERFEGWEWAADELTKIPDYYMLQVQHQMACTGAPYGVLVAFIGGAVRQMQIPRSEAIIAALRQEVASFWADLRAGKEPQIDWNADADTIMRVAHKRAIRTIELPATKAGLFQSLLHAKDLAKTAEATVKAAEAEIVHAAFGPENSPEGGVITCGSYVMKVTKVADNPGKLITPDMVGQLIGARRGHIRKTVSQKE